MMLDRNLECFPEDFMFRKYPKQCGKRFACLYLIGYFCAMEESKEHLRELYFSDEFWEFYHLQQDSVKQKFDYVLGIVRNEKVISAKFIKSLTGTDLYEMRVSVGTNEYRTVLFAVNNPNIILATKILVLNAFLKKSSKDYDRQVKKAIKILGGFQL